jgi:hypothetical protein
MKMKFTIDRIPTPAKSVVKTPYTPNLHQNIRRKPRLRPINIVTQILTYEGIFFLLHLDNSA